MQQIGTLGNNEFPEGRHRFISSDFNLEAPVERLAVNEAEKGDETGHCMVQRVSIVMTNKGRKASGGWWLMTVKVRERERRMVKVNVFDRDMDQPLLPD